MVAGLRRKAGLTPEEFRRHWREAHGPLIRGLPDFIKHIRRYVQMHPADAPMPADATGAEPWDGVAMMDFDSFEEMGRAFAEPIYLERVRPDEESFLDLARCSVLVVTEEVVWENLRGTGVKKVNEPPAGG
jgi:uncharacterized protein (TIGR02118 family)